MAGSAPKFPNAFVCAAVASGATFGGGGWFHSRPHSSTSRAWSTVPSFGKLYGSRGCTHAGDLFRSSSLGKQKGTLFGTVAKNVLYAVKWRSPGVGYFARKSLPLDSVQFFGHLPVTGVCCDVGGQAHETPHLVAYCASWWLTAWLMSSRHLVSGSERYHDMLARAAVPPLAGAGVPPPASGVSGPPGGCGSSGKRMRNSL
mmetsp:Transcript_7119/g.17265  ORF Transcript_7119/g.17265 Transcript_7119/m.17265 type:complete len:201 (-) Transcript_7119:407-1009(-)